MPRWILRWLECRVAGCHIRQPCPDHQSGRAVPGALRKLERDEHRIEGQW